MRRTQGMSRALAPERRRPFVAGSGGEVIFQPARAARARTSGRDATYRARVIRYASCRLSKPHQNPFSARNRVESCGRREECLLLTQYR